MPFLIEKPLVVIVGPTAVGKSEIAIQVAQKLNAEIISADSRYFYRGMNLGTAKPNKEDRAKIRHHLIDVAEPDEVWSLNVFKRAAYECIKEVHLRGKLPLLVGGTGQYIQAIVRDWNIPTIEPNHAMRTVINDWADDIGKEKLHDKLSIIDPVSATQIDARNVRRTIRALEVIFLTGRKFSTNRGDGPSPFDLKVIGITRPRVDLYSRIDQRIDQMLSQGLVNEVKGLLKKGYSIESPSFSAIGYWEIANFLAGKVTLDEAIILMKRRSRQFVRRQSNWFKLNDPSIQWFPVRENVVENIIDFIKSDKGWISKKNATQTMD